ncbi:MAG: hypothetical protein ACYDAE_25105 [Steroidobacteraceae bacterium]
MAAKHFMKEAFANAHGQLHAALGVPKGQKIPVSKLREAVRKGGRNARRAQLVLNADHPLR